MAPIEQLAEAALNGESLLLRSLTQDLLRENPNLGECPKPQTNDSRLLAAAASLVELLALRLGQTPPHRRGSSSSAHTHTDNRRRNPISICWS